MTPAERDQIRLILVDQLDRAETDVKAAIKALFHDHAARGLLRSGATIKRAAREMSERASSMIADSVHNVKAVDMSREAFAMIAEALERLNNALAAEFNGVIKTVEGRTESGAEDSDLRRAALALFESGNERLNRQLELHRFTFVNPSRSDLPTFYRGIPSSASEQAPAGRQAKGGRPPAEFWDDLWAHIAAALYGGSLIPKSQADIEKAMAEWIEGQGHSAATSTIRARARRLWDRIAADAEE